MKIARIEAQALDVGFQKQALQTARVASPMSRWPEYSERRASWMWPTKKVFVRIESQDGAVGWSCTNGGEVVALIITAHLAGLVADRTVDNVGELWDQMFFSLLPTNRSGFSMMAIAAVDIALWDLRAKLAGQPLTELLGGRDRDEIHAYATTPQPEVAGTDGWWGLKAAIPYGIESGDQGFEENKRLMARFRKSAGPDRNIMLDAFMAWDADYTLRFAEATGDLNVFWIEDPLPPYDIEGYRKIRKRAGKDIRLALGNFCFHRWDCAELLREGLVDVLQPDVAWAGGITESLRIMDMADAAHVPIILHNTSEQPWALAMAAARQKVPVVEFVDRGPDSALYSLMGAKPEWTGGKTRISASAVGNTPPPEIAAMFSQ
jgi:L-rhamnonate dehydratase